MVYTEGAHLQLEAQKDRFGGFSVLMRSRLSHVPHMGALFDDRANEDRHRHLEATGES